MTYDEDLRWAVTMDMPIMVKKALADGVDPNLITEGKHILLRAVLRAGKEVISLLVEAGSDPSRILENQDADGAFDVFQRVVKTGLFYNVEFLIDHWPETLPSWNSKCVNGKHPIHFCVENRHLDSGLWLLKKGVDPDIEDENGKSLAHLIKVGSLKNLRKLGGRLDKPDHLGNTPLWHALGGPNRNEVDLFRVKTLLECGVNPCDDPRISQIIRLAQSHPVLNTVFYNDMDGDYNRQALTTLLDACRPWMARKVVQKAIKKTSAKREDETSRSTRPKM